MAQACSAIFKISAALSAVSLLLFLCRLGLPTSLSSCLDFSSRTAAVNAVGGGAISEASEASLEFKDLDSFIASLNKIINNYDEYKSKIDYEYLGSERCCREYCEIIDTICG